MIELSIRRPTLVVVLFIILAILGGISFTQLNYELLPKFTAPGMSITTIYPGASPAEVENSVTKVIEDAVSSLEKIRAIKSSSAANFSIVALQLKQDADTDLLIQEAQRKLDAIASRLPNAARAPVISKISSDNFPIMNIGATSTLPTTAFYELMKERVQPSLSNLEGVGQITLIGGREREIRIAVKQDKLEHYKLSILQILQAIRQSNLDFPTGNIQTQEKQILVRLAGKFSSLDELRELVVFNSFQGNPIKLKEVAEVHDSEKDVVDLSRVNGLNSIGLSVIKKSDANAVEVSRMVEEALRQLEARYVNDGLQFSIATNTTDFTLEAIRAVTQDFILAIILVAAVMLLFLHSFRNSLIVVISIPASLITTLIVMNVLGYSINVLSLLAMSLVIGILVDDSIVVLENIFRHLEMGKSSRKAALDGSKEIFLTALSITLVLVVVFIPLALSTGIVAIIMRQFSIVVIISILMSLFVSYTIAPAMAARLSRLQQFKKGSINALVFGNFEKGLKRLSENYAGLLSWSLKNKTIVVIGAAALFFASFLLVTKGYIGTAFLTIGDRGEFIIQLELPKDATIRETNKAVQKVEEFLFAQPEVTKVFTTVGRQTGFLKGGRVSANLGELTVKLVDKRRREISTSVYSVQCRNALAAVLPGVKVTSNEVSFFGSAGDTPIQIIVSATDFAPALDYAGRLLQQIKKIEGTLAAELSTGLGSPEIDIEVDRARMSQLGLNMAMVGMTLQTAFSGNSDAQYRESGKEYDINIRLDAFDRNNIEDIAAITFMNDKGRLIKLSQFADIIPTIGPAFLQRQNRVEAVTVQAQVLGRPSGSIGAEIVQWVAENPPPAGVSLTYEGELKRQTETFASLGAVFIASILFVYLIMVALYDSYIYPFVVLFSIPVAIVGALLALALTMESLNIFSIVGIIMLNGLVAKNAILLVDFANQAKAEGLNTTDALIQAGKVRLRPILMTAISLIVGMIPIALAGGAASEWKNGLAWVIIGGLSSSTFLTLLLVPVVYAIADNVKGVFGGKKISRDKIF